MTRLFALGILAIAINGCSATYYGAKERMGSHKRDILVERVEEAREAHIAGRDHFRAALKQYQSVIAVEDVELEGRYDNFKDKLEDSESAAELIRERIDSVEDVADDLFEEWENEIVAYTNETLKASSQRKLDSTRQNYDRLIAAMRDSEKRLEPALETLRDHDLQLKHHLNAQTIASINRDTVTVTRDIEALLNAMQTAIEEADTFLSGEEDMRE